MTTALHCDGPGCNTWAMDADTFIEATEHERLWHFCTWDCLLAFAATVEPTVVIPNG